MLYFIKPGQGHTLSHQSVWAFMKGAFKNAEKDPAKSCAEAAKAVTWGDLCRGAAEIHDWIEGKNQERRCDFGRVVICIWPNRIELWLDVPGGGLPTIGTIQS